MCISLGKFHRSVGLPRYWEWLAREAEGNALLVCIKGVL